MREREREREGGREGGWVIGREDRVEWLLKFHIVFLFIFASMFLNW